MERRREMENNVAPAEKQQGQLQRKLGFWALVFFGIIMMAPTSSLVYYPITQMWSNGYSYIGYAIATGVICLTVLSYQIMLKDHPGAGSAYAFTSKAINGTIGFLVGWVLLMDYGLLPIFTIKIVAIYFEVLINVPVWVMIVAITVIVTICCCLDVKLSVTIEIVLGIYLIFLVLFVDFDSLYETITSGQAVFRPDCVYDPEQINMSGVFSAASLGILCLVGFDGITTLSEESKIPPQKMQYTLMVAVLIQGVLLVSANFFMASAMDWTTIPEEFYETAYYYMLTQWINEHFAFILVMLENIFTPALAIAAFTASSRILFSMGRNNIISKKFFGHLSPKTNVPVYSILFIGVVSIILGLALDWMFMSEVVSFGACTGFLFVNISVIALFWIKRKDHSHPFRHLIIPGIAALIILYIMINLGKVCLIAGGAWTLVGIIYTVVRYKTSDEFKARRHW